MSGAWAEPPQPHSLVICGPVPTQHTPPTTYWPKVNIDLTSNSVVTERGEGRTPAASTCLVQQSARLTTPPTPSPVASLVIWYVTRSPSYSGIADYPTILNLVTEPKTCAKCGEQPAGPGGVLCPGCREALGERAARYWHDESPTAAVDSPVSDAVRHTESACQTGNALAPRPEPGPVG